MRNINKERYNMQYETTIEYKYKTNTRYLRYLIKLLENHMEPKEIHNILDVGCGQGYITVLFCGDYPDALVDGVDLSIVGIESARRMWGGYNVDFKCCDITDENIEKGYDLVCAFEVLEHIEDWKSVAQKMCDISDKYIMVSSPVGRMREYEAKHGHVRNYKKGELEDFFSGHGYRTVKTFYAGFPFWSPITRDILNIMPGDSTKQQKNLNNIGKAASLMLYYLYRYCSSKHIGDQFIGLFERQ